MERTFCVYAHTNKLNGKKYFGITCRDPIKRFGLNGYGYLRQDKAGNYQQPAFAYAILKYGWDNFEHEILFSNLTEYKAKQKEKELIAQYHTYINDPECHGYNSTRGGEGKLLYKTEKEAIEANKKCIQYWIKERQQDPILYAKKLDGMRAAHAKRKVNPSKHEKDLEAARKTKRNVAIIRKDLAALYEQFPEYFTKEQYHLCFDRVETTSSKRNFCCYSYKKLSDILNNITERLTNNERSDDDFSEAI